MGNVEGSSHSSESADPQTTSTKGVPVSVSISSVKLIGYVRQGSRVTGDPGMTISISRSVGTTFSAGISASATAEAGVLFAKASVTAGVTVTTSWTTNRTEQGSWTIPNNGRRGWISIGSDKYRVTGRIRYATPSCTILHESCNLRWNQQRREFQTWPVLISGCGCRFLVERQPHQGKSQPDGYIRLFAKESGWAAELTWVGRRA